MGKKTWKDHLLSSGIPLEHSVREVLERYSVFSPSEYRYERTNEAGRPTVFSVDLNADMVFGKHGFWVSLFIECKYRHDETRWVFTPDAFEALKPPQFSDLFIALDDFARETVNRKYLNSLKGSYPLCGKGIEILPDGPNPKGITQAVQQLRFALADAAVNGIDSQVDEEVWGGSMIPILLPIIVTTAELWRISSGVTLEELRSAEELESVAKRESIVVLKQMPDNELRRHTRTRLAEAFDEEVIPSLDTFLAPKELTYSAFVERFSRKYPSLFLVVEYSRFADAMENLSRFFKQGEVLKQ